MTSLQTSLKQVPVDGGNFITLKDIVGPSSIKIFYDDGTGSGNGFFSNAAWPGVRSISTLLNQAGGVMRDMGRTVVSSGLTFRKIQLAVPGNGTTVDPTGGVYGPADSTAANGTNLSGYYTGYIQLGLGGGVGAPVARV